MQDCNPINTAIARDEGLNLKMCPKTLDKKKKMANISYSNAIGCLICDIDVYTTDICYAV